MSSPLGAAHYSTPFGPLAVFVTQGGSVVRSSFRSLPDAVQALPPAVSRVGWVERHDAAVAVALEAWADGDGSLLTTVPVEQHGAPFSVEVWDAVRQIPSGATLTYGEVAADLGRPRAARAVGTACARNLTTPFTPCHRVVAAGGIGGFGSSQDLKAGMIRLESVGVRGSRA